MDLLILNYSCISGANHNLTLCLNVCGVPWRLMILTSHALRCIFLCSLFSNNQHSPYFFLRVFPRRPSEFLFSRHYAQFICLKSLFKIYHFFLEMQLLIVLRYFEGLDGDVREVHTCVLSAILNQKCGVRFDSRSLFSLKYTS